MKKVIYGILALAIIAVVAVTVSSEPNPNLEYCPYAEVRMFEKSIPGTGGLEYMYWDLNDNYLGKEKKDGAGVCVFDSYPGICVEPDPFCNIV